MRKGIAVEFNRHFNIKRRITCYYPNDYGLTIWDEGNRGWCIYISPVFNLVTKRNYWDKPTLDTMGKALSYLKSAVVKYEIPKLAMPRIGCGLDRLKWEDVSALIKGIFSNVNVEILVCYQ